MQQLFVVVAKASSIDTNQDSDRSYLSSKKIKILPHEELCPEGITIEARADESILEACLRNKIKIEHACEMSCACTTCHIIVEDGFNNLEDATDERRIFLIKLGDLNLIQD